MLNDSFSTLILMFAIYAFLGWCIEVIYATIKTRKFINRGFLNGPCCPVYGFGVIAVLTLLMPIKDNLLILFIDSVLLTSSVEFITGYILEKSFNKKWWDYSTEPFNIKGYVCLWISIVWGLACVLVIYVLNSPINNTISLMSDGLRNGLALLLLVVILTDTVITLYSLSKVKQKIRLLDEIGDNIKRISDVIGKNLSDNTITAMKINDARKELSNLNKRYQAILDKRTIGYNRIAKAFPRLNLIRSKIIDSTNKIDK